MKLTTLRKMTIGLTAALTLGGATDASAESLRVGMECTYAPFNYRTSDGELVGYDVDVAKGVAEIIGADLEYVCQQWDGSSCRAVILRQRNGPNCRGGKRTL